jgi:hypothetical protein
MEFRLKQIEVHVSGRKSLNVEMVANKESGIAASMLE